MRNPEPAEIEDLYLHTGSQRARDLLRRREAPKFFIVDRDVTLVYCSTNLVGSLLLEESLVALKVLRREVTATTFEPLDPNNMLRLVPLSGHHGDCYAAFIETVASRRSLEAAVRRYDITKREAAVLALVIGGYSTTIIASQLAITEHTVSDHVKSLLRKTGTSRRSELVARIFHDESDAPGVRH